MAKKKKKTTRIAAAEPHGDAPVLGRVQTERDQTAFGRSKIYERIENQLRRPVVAYFTSFFHAVEITDNDADTLEDIMRHMDLSRGLALIINSPGGDGEAAERIVNLCRSYSGTGEYWAIVPGKAKSAATMICFGASKIMMGPSSELGPVDPQIIRRENGRLTRHSAYNLVTSYDFLFDGAVNTQGRVEPFLQQLEHYDARDIQRYRDFIELADDITVNTLKTGVMARNSEATIKQKVEPFLNPKITKSHGRPIFRDEAKNCGLRIENVESNGRRWDAIYELYIRLSQFVFHHVAKCVETKDTSFAQQIPPFTFDED